MEKEAATLTPQPSTPMVFMSVEQLEQVIDNVVLKRINEKQEKELQARYLSAKEVTALFSPKISLATVHNWSNQGLLKKHMIGGRCYYLYSEVLQATHSIKRYQKK